MEETGANGAGETVIPASNEQEKKQQRKEKSGRRREEKSLENVLKTIAHLPTPGEKFPLLCSKYSELAEELKQQQSNSRLSEKKLVLIQREKEKVQGDLTKALQTRNKLEVLCRELQKHNKAMKEESLLRIKEEEEKRKEVSAKFNTTLAEITALMQQNSESNSKLRDENQSIQAQFKGVYDQYTLREQQVEKIQQQMKLEGQLAEAKLAKARLELQAQKDILERDKAQLMAEVAIAHKKCEDHEKTEALLRGQLNVYFEKYDEFQNVLTKSNHVYAGFKSEMEKMSKKITRLEKETASWKQKWESSHKALLAMATEKQGKDQEVAQQARQLTQLQKLCRTMQAERTALQQQLKAAGITPSQHNNTENGATSEVLQSEATLVNSEPAKKIPSEATDEDLVGLQSSAEDKALSPPVVVPAVEVNGALASTELVTEVSSDQTEVLVVQKSPATTVEDPVASPKSVIADKIASTPVSVPTAPQSGNKSPAKIAESSDKNLKQEILTSVPEKSPVRAKDSPKTEPSDNTNASKEINSTIKSAPEPLDSAESVGSPEKPLENEAGRLENVVPTQVAKEANLESRESSSVPSNGASVKEIGSNGPEQAPSQDTSQISAAEPQVEAAAPSSPKGAASPAVKKPTPAQPEKKQKDGGRRRKK